MRRTSAAALAIALTTALAANALLWPATAAADLTALTLIDRDTVSGSLRLAASTFHGDGFWDANRVRGNQSVTLLEERLVCEFATPFQAGFYGAAMLPLLHRTVDLVSAGSRDADALGVGDAELSFGWRSENEHGGFRPGAELRWKTAAGRTHLAVEEVDRGGTPAVNTGTGGNEVDAWAGTTWVRGPFAAGAAVGYRHRFDARVAFLWNGALLTRGRLAPRVLVRGEAAYAIRDIVTVEGAAEAFREAEGNRVWAAFAAAGLSRETTAGRVRVRGEFPVGGRFYPDPPPFQFFEREPLLGTRLVVEFVWYLGETPTGPAS